MQSFETGKEKAFNRPLRVILRVWAFLLCFSMLARAENIMLDGVAAMVDDGYIMVSDVTDLMRYQMRNMPEVPKGDEKAIIRKLYDDSLKVLVEKLLILSAYKKQAEEDKNKSIPQKLMDDRIDSMMRDMSGGGKAEFMALLEKDGMGYEEWRKDMEEQVIVSQMRKMAVEQHIRVSPQAVLDYYDKNRSKFNTPARMQLSMIVLKKGTGADAAAAVAKKAEEIMARLKAGEDFGTVAKQMSEDDKAAQGGDWDWVEPGILRKELDSAISGLAVGQLSGVIETEEEIYIAKCRALEPESVMSLDQARVQIEKELRNVEAKALYEAWIERLKKSASIRVIEHRMP